MMLYAEVLLPLAVKGTFHYLIPNHLHSELNLVGRRVLVPFGSKRIYTGIIYAISSNLPSQVLPDKLRAIESLLDDAPLIMADQLSLWHWLADYYHCTLGQVMRQALPGGLMPESQTKVYLSHDYQASSSLAPDELSILDLLSSEADGISYVALYGRLGRGVAQAFVRLVELGAIYTEEVVKERYKPLEREFVGFSDAYQDARGVEHAFDLLKRSPAQARILQEFIDLLPDGNIAGSVPRTLLSQSKSTKSSLIRKLIDRGVLEIRRQIESRIAIHQDHADEIDNLEPITSLDSPVTLLYAERMLDKERAIASYVHQAISQGYQILLITPSTVDTPSAKNYIKLLQEASRGRMYSYHPSERESHRAELYMKLVQDNEPCLVLGGRSAVFLPMTRLGLIIVDDEHEYMLKQQYAPPYYHARDVALYRGASSKAPVLLASATPSAEALFNVFRKKYALIYKPYSTAFISPKIINVSELRVQRFMRYQDLLSPQLLDAMSEVLRRGKRILVLQNRRGYSPYLLCQACGKSIQCPQCSISLAYYAKGRYLGCTYCGYKGQVPTYCPSCGESQGSGTLSPMGYGVERIVEEVMRCFPDFRVLQIDSDSLQTSRSRSELHMRLGAGDVDIVVGTQLIKGQPLWDNIGLIAVVQLDTMLAYSDFRVEERAFQLLHQLRLRSQDYGEEIPIMIQTLTADHPFIRSFSTKSYSDYIKEQLAERSQFCFPPFFRLISIRLSSTDEGVLEQVGHSFSNILKHRLGDDRVTPLQKPSVTRIEHRHIRQIQCRRPYSEGFRSERQALSEAQDDLFAELPSAKRVRITYDIDPY